MKPILPADVHPTLNNWLVGDAMTVVCDLRRSREQFLHDTLTAQDFLDFFCFFAARPLAFNHPKMRDPVFLERLQQAALHKPSNCDLYTDSYATFVQAFGTVVLASVLPHLFFIEGGSPAVENALKAAMDWKTRKNLAAGRGEVGTQILHFKQCFHGRTGYCLSLTDSHDIRKTQYFPKFAWPRITNPKITFPLEGRGLEATLAQEAQALAEIAAAFAQAPHDIAAIIIEPIQGEGGDNYFRREFLQALRRICDEKEALLIFDEVQTGFGGTGRWWDYLHHQVVPDVLVFGKKTQVCGIAAGRRLDEVDSVFKVRSRISSTFSGNLVDMVRCERTIEIIEEDQLIANAASMGAQLLQGIVDLAATHKNMSAPRGRGLWLAFDMPSPAERDALIKACHEERLLIMPCGQRTVRMRPALDVTPDVVRMGIERLALGLRRLQKKS